MFRRYLFRNYRLLSALQHWLKRRLTPGGILVLWALFFAAGIGMDTDVTVAYQAFSFLVCLVIASVSFAYFSRGHYEARRILAQIWNRGYCSPLPCFHQESTRRRQRGLILLQNLADPRPHWLSLSKIPSLERKSETGLTEPTPITAGNGSAKSTLKPTSPNSHCRRWRRKQRWKFLII